MITNHPYYCSESSSGFEEYDNLRDFLDEWSTVDIDMNLVFRFDIERADEENDLPFAKIFIMHQRKGCYSMHIVRNIMESEIKDLYEFLNKHYAYIIEMWRPISNDMV